jgi:hypothetical protein
MLHILDSRSQIGYLSVHDLAQPSLHLEPV